MSTLLALQAEAERLARTVYPNASGHCRISNGDTFWRYRPYQGGEPVTAIDWRQSARSEKLFVREQEKEVVPTIYLWMGREESMRESSPRIERAQILLLALAHILLRDDFGVAMADQPRLVTKGITRFGALARRLSSPSRDEGGLPPPLRLARHTRMVLCGDFLTQPQRWQNYIRALAGTNRRGILLHVLPPAERESPLYAATSAPFRNLTKNIGWHYLPHTTDQPPHAALTLLHDFLADSGRT